MKSAKRTILVAGMGTSPAVLTETVWALARQEHSVVPDEVVMITTKSGKDALRTAVMSGTPSVWERLKGTICFVRFVRLISKRSDSVDIPLARVKCWIFKAPSLSDRKAA
jgi:CRISPR-associated protein (TIGR02584 family)